MGRWRVAPWSEELPSVGKLPTGVPVAVPFDESFLAFLPTFFTRLDRLSWSPLWFVADLFMLTVAHLPVFAWGLRRRNRVTSAPAWTAYLPLVPLVLIELTMRARWPGIEYLSESAFPVYVLHQAVIVLLGRFSYSSTPASRRSSRCCSRSRSC